MPNMTYIYVHISVGMAFSEILILYDFYLMFSGEKANIVSSTATWTDYFVCFILLMVVALFFCKESIIGAVFIEDGVSD